MLAIFLISLTVNVPAFALWLGTDTWCIRWVHTIPHIISAESMHSFASTCPITSEMICSDTKRSIGIQPPKHTGYQLPLDVRTYRPLPSVQHCCSTLCSITHMQLGVHKPNGRRTAQPHARRSVREPNVGAHSGEWKPAARCPLKMNEGRALKSLRQGGMRFKVSQCELLEHVRLPDTTLSRLQTIFCPHAHSTIGYRVDLQCLEVRDMVLVISLWLVTRPIEPSQTPSGLDNNRNT